MPYCPVLLGGLLLGVERSTLSVASDRNERSALTLDHVPTARPALLHDYTTHRRNSDERVRSKVNTRSSSL
jgi:hypothetical protein